MNFAKSLFRYLEKRVLELCLAATIKPRQIERSGFFYWTKTDKLEFTDYTLVLSLPDVRLWRKRNSQMEEDDCPPPTPPRELGLKCLV